MALTLQIANFTISLAAIFAQALSDSVQIDIEGIGSRALSTTYPNAMTDIVGLIHSKQYKQVIIALTTGLYVQEFCHKYLWLQAFCNLELGNLEKAAEDLIQGRGRDPLNQRIIDFISIEIFLSLVQYEQEAYRKMKSLPYYELLKLGDRLCSKREFKGALQCYSEAFLQFKDLSISPCECYISRGNCYIKMEKFNLSLVNFKLAEACNPSMTKLFGTDGVVQVLFIHALFDAGFYDKALESMNDLESEDDVVSVIEGILKKTKNLDEAHQFFSRAIKKYPKNAILYEKRGHYHWKMKKYEEAIKDFRKAKELNSSLINSWISLIKVLLLTGEYAEAKKVLEDFDELVILLNNSELVELEDMRLRILRTKEEKNMDDETNAEN